MFHSGIRGASGESMPAPVHEPTTGRIILVYAIVVLMLVSFKATVLKNEVPDFAFKIPLADLAICVALAAWLAGALRSRRIEPPGVFSPPLVAFIVVSTVSMLVAGFNVGSAKELIQGVVQFIGGYIVITSAIGSRQRLRSFVTLVAVVAAVAVAYGLVQYGLVGGRYHLVSSVFDNRNVFGGYIALVTPLLFGASLGGVSTGKKLFFGAVVAAGLLVTTSITSFLSIFAAIVLMLVLRRRSGILIAGTVVLFAAVAAVPLGVRIGDLSGLKSAMYEPVELERYHDEVQICVELIYLGPVGEIDLGDDVIFIESSMIPVRSVSERFIRHYTGLRKKDEQFGEGGHLHQRLLNWLAGINVLRDHPVVGVGVGNYQEKINLYYLSAPKLNTMESDTQSGYIVTLVTTGLMGLAALFWIIADFLRRAVRNARLARDPFVRELSWGAAGSMIAFSINNMFSPLIYQSTVIQFVILLSIIGATEYLVRGRTAGTGDGETGTR
jgi:hypothetical protein